MNLSFGSIYQFAGYKPKEKLMNYSLCGNPRESRTSIANKNVQCRALRE